MRLFEWEWSWESKPMPQPWHSLLLAMFGIAILTASAYDYLSTREFLAAAVRTTGVVIEVRQAGGIYYPRVSFVDSNGVRHIFDSKLRTTPAAFSQDEEVAVLYLASAPEDARIERFFELWFRALVTAVIGFALSLTSVLIWIYRRRLFPQYQESPNPALKRTRKSGAPLS